MVMGQFASSDGHLGAVKMRPENIVPARLYASIYWQLAFEGIEYCVVVPDSESRLSVRASAKSPLKETAHNAIVAAQPTDQHPRAFVVASRGGIAHLATTQPLYSTKVGASDAEQVLAHNSGEAI